VTVGISARFRRVGLIVENPEVMVEVRIVKSEVRNQGSAELSSHSSRLSLKGKKSCIFNAINKSLT
jgi:hypothetical protein